MQHNSLTARSTAKGNNLCLRHWRIDYLGKALTIPDSIRQIDMSILGIYSFIDPEDDTFAEGLHEDAWISANAAWLAPRLETRAIPASEGTLLAFYHGAIPHDWRCGSCGGCL